MDAFLTQDLPAGDVLTSDPARIRQLLGIGDGAWPALLYAMPRDAKRGLCKTLGRLIAGRIESGR